MDSIPEPDSQENAAAYFAKLPRNMVQNTMRILDHEDAILKRDPDHFEVLSLRTPSRRVRVYRNLDVWRCRVDSDNNQDRPCSPPDALAPAADSGDSGITQSKS